MVQNAHFGVSIFKLSLTFIAKVNALLGRLKEVRPKTQAEVFLRECCSFYGSNLWGMRHVQTAETTWKVAIRRMLRLSPLTRSRYLHHLMGTKQLALKLHMQFISFAMSCLSSRNPVVSEQAYRSLHGQSTFFKGKVGDIIYNYGLRCNGTLTEVAASVRNLVQDDLSNPPPEAVLIKELIDVRDGAVFVPGLDEGELNDLLVWCCVS